MTIIRISAVLMGLTVLVMIGLLHVVRAAPPTAQTVTFRGNQDGWLGLYRMNGDGSGLRRLTVHSELESPLRWSPDGRWIAYTFGTYVNRLYRMRSNASHQEQLLEIRGTISGLEWSPDGRWLAFILTNAPTAEDWGLYRVRADGSHLEQLTDAVTYENSYLDGLSWSPDGEWLLFSQYVGEPPFNVLLRVRTDGSSEQVLHDDNYTVDPIWSPNGDWVLVTQRRREDVAHTGIYRMRDDGSDLEWISFGFEYAAFPAWSPDGEWIVFSGHRDGQTDLYRMRVNGTDLRQLTNNVDREQAVEWLKNGQISYLADTNARTLLYQMQDDGSGLVDRLPSFGHSFTADWSPLIDLEWGPSGLGIGGLVLLMGGVGIDYWRRVD